MKKKNLLSGLYVDRTLRKNGAKQISLEAQRDFVRQLEEMGEKIIKLAKEVAKSDGRETIREGDINFVLGRIK